MMFLEPFYQVFESVKSDCALIYKDDQVTYAQFLKTIEFWHERIGEEGIPMGQVVGLRGDFTPNSMAILFALIENQNIIVPFDFQQSTSYTDKYEISKVQTLISVDNSDQVVFEELNWDGNSPLYDELHEKEHPGLVLFTSGTSGQPKAAVHDFVRLLEKFKKRTKTFRTLNFLLFDHWGGLNTMFHTLANAGTVLALKQRGPASVCAFIEKHKIDLLPASPTFFNLLLISQEYLNYDLSSLKLITYGTEPMPESTLQKIKEVFPDVRLQQTYGLIELGVMRSRSKSDGSLWLQVGGEGYQTRVVSGLLEIKAESAMLGYLNAQSPFTRDGWFKTGDMVEVDGDYIKIMGRKSELINVGGEKVYPTEVESVLKQLDNVVTAVVYGEKHVITGNIVCAKILLDKPEEKRAFVKRLKSFSRERMSSFKVPVKVELVTELSELYSYRMKTKRV
jgi:long-chain acyl-CoA synthetase